MSVEPADTLTYNQFERTTIAVLPLGDRVIVQQLSEETITRSGIIIPDVGQEKPSEGVIVALGEGRLIEAEGYRIAPSVQLGHRVLFGKYAGYKIKIDEAEYIILREDELLAINFRPAVPSVELTAEEFSRAFPGPDVAD